MKLYELKKLVKKIIKEELTLNQNVKFNICFQSPSGQFDGTDLCFYANEQLIGVVQELPNTVMQYAKKEPFLTYQFFSDVLENEEDSRWVIEMIKKTIMKYNNGEISENVIVINGEILPLSPRRLSLYKNSDQKSKMIEFRI